MVGLAYVFFFFNDAAPSENYTLSLPDALPICEPCLGLRDIMSNGVGIPANGNEYVVGPWLTFDPETEQHKGAYADEANALLKDSNRDGFVVPSVKDV